MRIIKPYSLVSCLSFSASCFLHLASCFLLLVSNNSSTQEGTRNTNTDSKTSDITGKIMIVPFEPKLYLSEIDMKVNEQTKWKFDQIRENFRHQLDTQLKLKLQSVGTVLSFYSDSATTWKDLMYTYKSTGLSPDLVGKPTDASSINKKESGIKDGEVHVEMSNDKKFMNTKITDKELLSYLNTKYQSEYFVFVNELDILSVPDSYDMSTDSYKREVAVHYSIIDKTGKTLNAGLLSSRFSSKESNPKKIVALCFSPIATSISAKLSDIINPKPTTTNKK